MDRFFREYQQNVFGFDGKYSVLGDGHLGIVSDIASILTPGESASKLTCFQGCPYSATTFFLETLVDGEEMRAQKWLWLPNMIYRTGENDNFTLETLTAVVPGARTIVQKVVVTNKTDATLNMPVALRYRGRAFYNPLWRFSIPKAHESERKDFSVADDLVTADGGLGAAFHIQCSLPGMKSFPRAYLWENELTVQPGQKAEFYTTINIGAPEESRKEALELKGQHEQLMDKAFAYLEKETARVRQNIPTLHTDCPDLDAFYYRSLVTYIMCRWENPELYTVPYYSTGSVNGSCMCSYLWDYCGGLMLHPIFDPEGNKKQLRAYLRNDLTKCYALNPVDAGPVGPWYQINQEKIILMVYHHVRATGQVEFLHEQVGDKTVLEWMLYHAYVCDDVTKPVELYDYGVGGDDHLEIARWGNGPYNGVMPDLNARRYMNYMRAYELSVLAGQPDENLPKRAAELKEVLKPLWNEDVKWYDFIDANGNRDVRYTVQMFKFIDSDVIDDDTRQKLISHLNDQEFLSKFGLHSMSKLDPQYDQEDIDNGGGGICTHFTLHICLQLYLRGYAALANDILRRIYWWGTRLPYMGDSCAANIIANRENTPLQGDISSTSVAQTVFYGVFGIAPHFDGSITICPAKDPLTQNMTLENCNLLGRNFTVQISGNEFRVTCNGTTQKAVLGETITL